VNQRAERASVNATFFQVYTLASPLKTEEIKIKEARRKGTERREMRKVG
jgi:hypothetical protein